MRRGTSFGPRHMTLAVRRPGSAGVRKLALSVRSANSASGSTDVNQCVRCSILLHIPRAFPATAQPATLARHTAANTRSPSITLGMANACAWSCCEMRGFGTERGKGLALSVHWSASSQGSHEPLRSTTSQLGADS
eukprot:4841223-Prymnesium_polylepis.1